MVLHVEVYLIPPRGLPTIGPPKSCRPTQRLTLHSFFCKFYVPPNDCQVCVVRSTSVSVAPEMTDWNASLNWSDWSVRRPRFDYRHSERYNVWKFPETFGKLLIFISGRIYHTVEMRPEQKHTPTRLKSGTKSNKTIQAGGLVEFEEPLISLASLHLYRRAFCPLLSATSSYVTSYLPGPPGHCLSDWRGFDSTQHSNTLRACRRRRITAQWSSEDESSRRGREDQE